MKPQNEWFHSSHLAILKSGVMEGAELRVKLLAHFLLVNCKLARAWVILLSDTKNEQFYQNGQCFS